jgi:CheY-like chemotaxis protein
MKEKIVYVVDDDRLIQNFLEYSLISKEGYSVKVFSNAEECIKNLDKKPDIIVLDHSFIGKEENLMTGLEALEEIRKTDPKVPIIILSKMQDEELITSYYSKGATDYISKEGFFINNLFEAFERNTSK